MSLKIMLGDTKKVDISCPRSQMNRLNYNNFRETGLKQTIQALSCLWFWGFSRSQSWKLDFNLLFLGIQSQATNNRIQSDVQSAILWSLYSARRHMWIHYLLQAGHGLGLMMTSCFWLMCYIIASSKILHFGNTGSFTMKYRRRE